MLINYKKQFGIWGIIFSFFGTFLLAFSTFEHTGSYVENISGTIKLHLLLVDSILFKLSLGIIALGFMMQLIERLLDSIPKKYYQTIFVMMNVIIFILIWLYGYRIFGY